MCLISQVDTAASAAKNGRTGRKRGGHEVPHPSAVGGRSCGRPRLPGRQPDGRDRRERHGHPRPGRGWLLARPHRLRRHVPGAQPSRRVPEAQPAGSLHAAGEKGRRQHLHVGSDCRGHLDEAIVTDREKGGAMKLLTIVLFCAAAALTAGCADDHPSTVTAPDVIIGKGTIVGRQAECSSWYLQADSGVLYEAPGLASEFREMNLRVSFTIRERNDRPSLCMRGSMAEIIAMERL